MKLNLLPTYVSKGKQTVAAWVVFAIILVVCVLATVGMIQVSGAQYTAAKKAADDLEPAAANAVKVGDLANDVINNAKGVILNSMLAEAMIKHNPVYADFYDSVRPHIPSFFRINSMTAAPDSQSPDTLADLTLTGVIQTQQQYRDLMLALNQIPHVQTVSRSGFDSTGRYVPGLIETDQMGRPILPTDSHIPDDPLERLNYFIQKGQAGVTGFTGAGGFGTGAAGAKGAMPGWSVVTVTVVLPYQLQTPDPRATLAGAGATPAAATTGGPMTMGMGGGPPTSMPGGGASMPAPPPSPGAGGSTPKSTGGAGGTAQTAD